VVPPGAWPPTTEPTESAGPAGLRWVAARWAGGGERGGAAGVAGGAPRRGPRGAGGSGRSRQATLASELDHPDAKGRIAPDYRAFKELRNHLFYPSECSVDKSGKLTIYDQSLPGPSAMVRAVSRDQGVDGTSSEANYALLSATAHPTLFAIDENLEHWVADAGSGLPGISEEARNNAKAIGLGAALHFHSAWQLAATWLGQSLEEVDQFKVACHSVLRTHAKS